MFKKGFTYNLSRKLLKVQNMQDKTVFLFKSTSFVANCTWGLIPGIIIPLFK